MIYAKALVLWVIDEKDDQLIHYSTIRHIGLFKSFVFFPQFKKVIGGHLMPYSLNIYYISLAECF